MNNVNWTQVLVFGVVVLLVFLIGAGALSAAWGGWGPMGMMSGGGPGGMMGGWGVGLFGWLFMLLWLLFPLGLLVLMALGAVWLFRQISEPTGPAAGPPRPAEEQACPNCGRPVQADWQLCPYCGQELT